MVCAWCCVRCKPRYKRHVDNIFPVDPKDGLVKGEMQKLTYYALTNPRKLDRIGNYLADYLKYYVDHRRFEYAAIAMKAMEQLLQACRSASINLFVESFLRMVQKLLESAESSLQILGSTSFVHFANIQEDTPSYHRRYDFFVSKFSSMCWSNGKNDTNRAIRQAGLKGLQGVILKTVSDDLQVNIWEEIHIQKIMRALLFNIQEGFPNFSVQSPSHKRSLSPWEGENTEANADIEPDQLAQHVLQDLVSRASFGHIKSLMLPFLYYMDNKNLWVPNNFPIHCMSLIMHSIQMQSAYLAIAQLLAHLDEHKGQSARLRCSIVEVVSAAVSIATTECNGPTILEVFGSLLKYLKLSIEMCNASDVSVESVKGEEVFQDAIVQSVGTFSATLQTYQKIEICTFLLGKMPNTTTTEEECQYERMLLQCVMKITTSLKNKENGKSTGISTLFPLSLIGPLQKLSLSDSPKTRTMVQLIFHSILDRLGNHDRVVPTVTLGDLPEENIFIGPQNKQDALFLRRQGPEIYFNLYESLLREDNDLDNYTCAYRTAVLWCLEVPVDEVMVELIHMAFGLQDEACSTSRSNVNILHAIVAALLIFASRYSRNEALYQHINTVVRRRQNDKPHLLPPLAFSQLDKDSEAEVGDDADLSGFMFDASVVAECLSQQGVKVDRLSDPYHYKRLAIPRTPESVKSLRVSMIDARVSDVQINLQEEITFDSLKQALQHRQQQQALTGLGSRERLFSQESYDESVARNTEKSSHIYALKQQIFGSLKGGEVSPTESMHSLIDLENLNNLSIELPDMYVY